MISRLFGVGIGGPRLTSGERRILEGHPPRAVILFRRNIEEESQVCALVREIRKLPGSPVVCVDQEGGPVDRFRDLLGPSISLFRAAAYGSAMRAGELAGEVCARFGIGIDLAPVVDRAIPGAGERVLGERAAGGETEGIVEAAGEFLQGLHSRGVGGCLKHFPGLGRARLDTHRDLPRIETDAEEESRDLRPFDSLMEEAGAVMISHAAGPDGLPASLSRDLATGLLRDRLGFAGAAFSDDLEMGALSGFGELPERCVGALSAGCDLLFICKEIEAYPQCVEAVEREAPRERIREAASRLDSYEESLERLRAEARLPERPLPELAADIRALADRGGGAGLA